MMWQNIYVSKWCDKYSCDKMMRQNYYLKHDSEASNNNQLYLVLTLFLPRFQLHYPSLYYLHNQDHLIHTLDIFKTKRYERTFIICIRRARTIVRVSACTYAWACVRIHECVRVRVHERVRVCAHVDVNMCMASAYSRSNESTTKLRYIFADLKQDLFGFKSEWT